MKPVAYTHKYVKPANAIITECKISEAYDAAIDSSAHPDFVKCEAIWDTGAMRTTISEDLAHKLCLQPLGQNLVLHTDGESIRNYYVINLLLPNNIEVKMLVVNDARLKDVDMLIGMDIISMCDFAISGAGSDMLQFSFQIPGCRELDFCQGTV